MNNLNSNNMEQEPLDRWIEEQSRKEAEKRVAAMFEVALRGFDGWAARRRRRMRLAAVFVSVTVTAVAAGWLLFPRQQEQDSLTACEPPQSEIGIATVERAPAAPSAPSIPAKPAPPIPAKPAPLRNGEGADLQAAVATVPPDVREEPLRYGELVCNNNCDPDSVISRIRFHCGGEEVDHG